jgi:zinc transport system ATP-binding protein
MAEKTVVQVQDLGVSFHDHKVIKDMSFRVDRGETLALIGPNGCGKSVLLRAMLGLIEHTGTVSWSPGVSIGYVPQSLSVERDMPLTVGEFFGCRDVDRSRTLDLLEHVGMGGDHETSEHARQHITDHVIGQRLGTLSGGQLQRVLVAWSLATDPDVLLFDEPTSGIDIGGQETIYTLLAQIRKKRELTVVLISHDLDVVYEYADHVLCVSERMMCHGPPQQTLNAETLKKLYGSSVAFPEHISTHEH